MSPARTSSTLSPGSAALPTLLLAGSLVLMGLLTLQAYRAEHAREAGARQTLLGYARVVAFQHGAEAFQLLNRDVPAAFSALDRAPAGQDGVDALLSHEGEADRCGASLRERWSFRFPVPEGGSGWDEGVRADSAHWGGSPPSETERARVLSAVRGRLEGLGRDGGAYGILVSDGGGDAVVVAYAIRWRPPPENTSVYGFRSCLDRGGESLFRVAMLGRPALPPALTGGLAPDSVHTALVELDGGATLWSGPVAGAEHPEDTASLALWPPFEAMTLRIALRPVMRPILVPEAGGGRLGLTFTLFALNGILLLAALVQMRRERQLVRLREGFLSAVSHELRTPLQQMLLYGDLLQMGGLRSAEERERAVEVVVRETHRLIHLVENVLRFRPGVHRAEPARAEDPYPFDPFVASVVEEFRPLAESRRVTLSLDPGSRLDTDWRRDSVRRVLLNLLDNAVKYGPARGTVTVRTRAHEGALCLEVDDEGSGVPDREAERVFEPYVRGTLHAEGETGGTGIGLAIVRDLVRAAGGRVRIGRAGSGGASVLVKVPALAQSNQEGR